MKNLKHDNIAQMDFPIEQLAFSCCALILLAIVITITTPQYEYCQTEHNATILDVYHDNGLLTDDYCFALEENGTRYTKYVSERDYTMYRNAKYYIYNSTEKQMIGDSFYEQWFGE